jgi:hypothetical protein
MEYGGRENFLEEVSPFPSVIFDAHAVFCVAKAAALAMRAHRP